MSQNSECQDLNPINTNSQLQSTDGRRGESPGAVLGVDWMCAGSQDSDEMQDLQTGPDSHILVSKWAQDDDPTDGAVQGSGWTSDDYVQVPDGPWDSPPYATNVDTANGSVDEELSDPHPVKEPTAATGESGGAAHNVPENPLDDRDVLEFALYQRSCAGRRKDGTRDRITCTRPDPCEDCAQHDGAYVPSSFWQSLSLDVLDLRLRDYLDRRPSLPLWRSRRILNLQTSLPGFGPANAPPWPTFYRDTTPEPPVFATPPIPDEPGNRD
ncbi:hypothetical protein AURDEDRAFT_171044 [Auricularia subglabra TFB-10046 SS5]|nr:hypothetical protein AURDEDRAFT_171044 [Auricularia subglabra TFB-10046 SS5]